MIERTEQSSRGQQQGLCLWHACAGTQTAMHQSEIKPRHNDKRTQRCEYHASFTNVSWHLWADWLGSDTSGVQHSQQVSEELGCRGCWEIMFSIYCLSSVSCLSQLLQPGSSGLQSFPTIGLESSLLRQLLQWIKLELSILKWVESMLRPIS